MIKELLSEDFDKKIAVIGIGNIGQEIILYLKAHGFKNEIVCVVDDGCRKRGMYQNIPIIEMSEFIQTKNIQEYIFVNTITSVETEAYHEILNKIGIRNIVDFNTRQIQADLSIKRVKKSLEKRGITLDDPILRIDDFIFPNPFWDMPVGIQMTFARDAGDLVFPIWLEDESVCVYGPYESEHVKIEKGDIVIDIGANIGIGVANAIARGCEKVYAIEPVMNEMIIKCREFYGEKMALSECAIGNSEGCVDIWMNPDITRNSSIYCVTNDLIAKKKVNITTLDQFIMNEHIQRVDFIKIYIDDKDLGEIEGAKNILKMMHPRLAIFPYASENTESFKWKVCSKIQEINADYKVECHFEKIFAYVE